VKRSPEPPRRPSDWSGPPIEPFDQRDSGLDVSLARIAKAIECIQVQVARIADHFDPPPADKVGTPYIAQRLGCTTVWVTEMVRKGEIPSACVVSGTGFGRPWKFFRACIDEWLENR